MHAWGVSCLTSQVLLYVYQFRYRKHLISGAVLPVMHTIFSTVKVRCMVQANIARYSWFN